MGAPVDHIKSLSEAQIKGDEIVFELLCLDEVYFCTQDSQELGEPNLYFLPDQQCDGTEGHLSLLRQLCIWPVILRE